MIEWDREHRVTAWNPAAEAIFGFPAGEAIGKRAPEFIAPPGSAEAVESMWLELAETRDGTKVSLENITRSGRAIQCEWYNTPLVDPGGRIVGFASLVQDVTERLNTERTIHYMAHHDALTGLPNRRLMQDRLNQAIMQARRKQRHVAVLFLDLDRFKLLNDTLGHDTGDYILKDVARRLTSCVREVDTVSREGGDEFVVVLPDLERPENARIVADKILREFSKPVEIGGQDIHITTSIGIAHYPNDATDVNHLLKHADSAMYQAKDSGRNTVRFYTSDLNYLLSRRLEVEGRLRKGIEQEEFFLRYQPQVDVATGRITGMETLLRWNDPVKGEVFPKDFISVAEELGLIVQLGEWAFRTACRQLKSWEAEGVRDVTVAVNLSARQFMSRKLVPRCSPRARVGRGPPAPGGRDHRNHGHAQPRAVHRDPGPASLGGHRRVHRRLRRGLLLAGAAAAAAGHGAQDRPLLRGQRARRRLQHLDRRGDHRHGQEPGCGWWPRGWRRAPSSSSCARATATPSRATSSRSRSRRSRPPRCCAPRPAGARRPEPG
ncbi:MAG: diguanylate cyclase [Burkholderiales bacterium]|nr:diguanylate cyclase [Burkholderiales bacterium]